MGLAGPGTKLLVRRRHGDGFRIEHGLPARLQSMTNGRVEAVIDAVAIDKAAGGVG
jgi:hypothetical protein